MCSRAFITPSVLGLSMAALDEATTNWDAACDRFQTFALAQSREVERISRVHRDPFEPI
jgi:hypothetical protein